jgi:predicted DNA-binding antitoxin AbrB/MazE fold protein
VFFILSEEGEDVRIVVHLSKEQREQLDNLKSPGNKIKKKCERRLRRRDWEEIMVLNMDTYTRRNGAIRRRK